MLETSSRQSGLSFIPNMGQINSQALYYAQNVRYGIYFESKNISFNLINSADEELKELRGLVFRQEFLDANSETSIKAQKETGAKVNYLKANQSYTGLSTYREIIYQDLWQGIDLILQGDDKQLKYDFVVYPGADIKQIQIRYSGINSLSINETGDLLINTNLGELIDKAPICYQVIAGKKTPVKASYVLADSSEGSVLTYEIESDYNPDYTLVIDPSLQYSTFLGGTDNEEGKDIAVDADGYAYVTGGTYSNNFPMVPGSYCIDYNTAYDAFISKVSQDGSSLIWSTFLCGNGNDWGNGIALDSDNNVYVAGSTDSTDFPTSFGAYQTTMTGVRCAFISKLSADGTSLLYSTYLGGDDDDYAYDIDVDSSAYAYVTGETTSTDFPDTIGSSYGGGPSDAFVTKVNTDGSALIYSRYLGGSDEEHGIAIRVDDTGNAYVAGVTASSNFPATSGAYDETYNGNYDIFITKLDSSAALTYSTFLGGDGADHSWGLDIDGEGNVYVTGCSTSSDYPTTPGAYQELPDTDCDAVVSKLNPSGSALVYSSYLAGSNADYGKGGIVVDSNGNACICGGTNSADFPTTYDAYSHDKNFSQDAFFVKLNSSGSALIYSTYIGGGGIEEALGIAIDPSDNIYITGYTYSPDFPHTSGAFQEIFGGLDTFTDAFVLKFNFEEPPLSCATFRLTRFVVNTTDDFPDEAQQMDADFILQCDDRKVIHGIVRDPDGTPLPAAVVVFFKLAEGHEHDDPETTCNLESIGHAITDDCGQFIVGPLPPDVNLIMKIFFLKDASVIGTPSPIIGTATPIEG